MNNSSVSCQSGNNFNSSNTINSSIQAMSDLAEAEAFTIVNVIAMGLSIVTLILLAMILVPLKQCKRLPKQIKWLSFNFIVSDMSLFVVYITMTCVLFSVDKDHFEIIFNTRMALMRELYAVNWATTTGFAVERLIILTMPLRFHRFINERSCVVYLSVVWVVNFVVPSFIYFLQIKFCYMDPPKPCDCPDVMGVNRILCAILFSAYSIVIVVSFVKIVFIVKSQISKIQSTTYVPSGYKQNQYQLTRTILCLIMAYTIFHLPLVVHSFIFLVRPDAQTPTLVQFLQILSFACIILNSYISLYLYIWKIPECRLKVMLIYCLWNEKYKQQANELKTELFNVVTITKT